MIQRHLILALQIAVFSVGLSSPALSRASEQSFTLNFSSPTIAKRADAVVTEAELNAQLLGLDPGLRKEFLESPNRFTERLRIALLEKALFNDFLASSYFENLEVKAEIYSEIVRSLAQQQRDRFVASQLLEDYHQQALEAYLANREAHRTSPEVTFRQIVLAKTRRDSDELRKFAEGLVKSLEDGADFLELASRVTDDPEFSEKKGQYPSQALDQLGTFYSQALKQMEPSEIELFEAENAFVILEVLEKKEGKVPSFEEVSDQIQAAAKARHTERIIKQYLEEKSSGALEIPEGAVESFLAPYDVEWKALESNT